MATQLVGIKLEWQDHNDFEEGFRVYKSQTEFDETNLPAIYETLPPNTTQFIDQAVEQDKNYYYMVSTFFKSHETFVLQTLHISTRFPETIGEPWQGGYYIGNITFPEGDDAGTYAIIMAGLDGQSPTTLQWKTTNTGNPNTVSLNNGLANTQAMIAAGIASHPAAEFCVNYDGGTFTDWYLPSKDELNLAWVNRTSLADLAMPAEYFWSSSQHPDQKYAWRQYTGSQIEGSKTLACRVRPVRRLKLML